MTQPADAAAHGRMEIGIESLRLQTVHVGAAAFAAGEVIITQYAYKFTTEEFAAAAEAAGFAPRQVWIDADRMFESFSWRRSCRFL